MARVIVSTGHTNDNPGTVVNDIREVDVARKIAKYVVSGLRSAGVITLSVPYNMPLERRLSWINMTGYKKDQDDVLIEIHANEGGKTGVEAWYIEGNDGKSQKLANQVTDSIKSVTGLQIQGVNNHKTHELGNLKLLEDANPVGILLECLYLDNEEDRKFLEDESKVQKLGDAIVQGISKFFGINISQNEKPAEKPKQNNDQPKNEQPKQDKQEKQEQKPKNNADDNKPTFNNNNQNNSNFGNNNYNNNSNNFGNAFGGGNNNSMAGFSGNNGMGGNTFGGDSFGGGFGGGSAFGSGNNNKPNMTRDERKEMINKMYKKGLGRDPEQGDLNYFLNIGISEEQMMKRLLDSQEHLDIVSNAKKYEEVKKQYDEVQGKYDTLEKSTADQRAVMEKLNSLLLQKNQALGDLQKKILMLTGRLEELQLNKKFSRAKVDYKGSLLDRIFNYFSKKLS